MQALNVKSPPDQPPPRSAPHPAPISCAAAALLLYSVLSFDADQSLSLMLPQADDPTASGILLSLDIDVGDLTLVGLDCSVLDEGDTCNTTPTCCTETLVRFAISALAQG